MTTTANLPLPAKIRLGIQWSLPPLSRTMAFIIRRLPDNTQVNIKELTFIGTEKILDQAVSVLADVQACCPDLYETLTIHQRPVFCYCPWMQKSSSQILHFFIGNETICWGKAGLLSHFVWTAFKMKANLHQPSVSFTDYYSGGLLMKNVAFKTSNWLMDHNQPFELAQSFERVYMPSA